MYMHRERRIEKADGKTRPRKNDAKSKDKFRLRLKETPLEIIVVVVFR